MGNHTSSLTGSVAVVTGAASGIGRAVAVRLADCGSDVVIADVRSSPRDGDAEPTHERIQQRTERSAAFVQCDVRDPTAFQDVIEKAREFGGVDVMVNNAGILRMESPLAVSESSYERVMDVNAKGTFFGTQAAAAAMRQKGSGVIINLSSTAAATGDGMKVPYCASKGAIESMTFAFADAFGPDVRVVGVRPGPVESAMTRHDSEVVGTERGARAVRATALDRLGEGTDIADAIEFLASDEASFITGEILTIDGGLSSTR